MASHISFVVVPPPGTRLVETTFESLDTVLHLVSLWSLSQMKAIIICPQVRRAYVVLGYHLQGDGNEGDETQRAPVRSDPTDTFQWVQIRMAY